MEGAVITRVLTADGSSGEEIPLEVTLDLGDQRLRLSIPPLLEDGSAFPGAVDDEIYPSLREAPFDCRRFLSAPMLAWKAKAFDDGLLAAVELAVRRGTGRCPGKAAFVRRLLEAAIPSGEPSGAAVLAASAILGGERPDLPEDIAWAAEKAKQRFLEDPLLCRPLGFYAWSEELRRLFRSDRMLQSELKEPAARSLAAALAQDGALRRDYGALLDLAARLTNPFARRDLRGLVDPPGAPLDPMDPACLFPPSRSRESDLAARLFGNAPVPEGFDLSKEFYRRVRYGILRLDPREDSGWYDHQCHALEPLAAPERSPESARLSFAATYIEALEELFRSLLAFTRETHVKGLECPRIGAALQLRILIQPGLTLEPLPTVYLRRARSYRFLRRVLAEDLGGDALGELRRLTPDGVGDLPLGEELRRMEAIFRGAHLRACREIGLNPDEDPDLGSGEAAAGDLEILEEWGKGLGKDPDLSRDVRMMVPVFHDIRRGKTRVVAVLGVSSRPLEVEYMKEPRVASIRGEDGAVVEGPAVRIEFEGERHARASIVSTEVEVEEVLDREAFRAHCDRHRTFEAIVANLR